MFLGNISCLIRNSDQIKEKTQAIQHDLWPSACRALRTWSTHVSVTDPTLISEKSFDLIILGVVWNLFLFSLVCMRVQSCTSQLFSEFTTRDQTWQTHFLPTDWNIKYRSYPQFSKQSSSISFSTHFDASSLILFSVLFIFLSFSFVI